MSHCWLLAVGLQLTNPNHSLAVLQKSMRFLLVGVVSVFVLHLTLQAQAAAKNPLNDAVDDIVNAWRAGTPPPELWRQIHGVNAVFMDHVKEHGFDWASGAAEKDN